MLKIKDNFLENFFVKFIFLFLIIFGAALTFVVFGKYNIFLNFLPFIAAIIIVFILLYIFLNKEKIDFKKNKIDYLTLIFILLFCIFNAFYFSEYSIEGGHDQGSYLESALLLAKTGDLYTNNTIVSSLPGFSIFQNGIRHHFLPGQAVYLSIFYKLFNFTGFPIALSFLLFLSASIIYFLCKKLRNWKTGAIFLLFFLFNFYTIYFTRATYVENLQLFFIWFYVYLFLNGYLKKDFGYIVLSFLPLAFLTTIRLEAILYIIVYFFLVFYLLFKKEFEIDLKKHLRYFVVFLFGILVITNIFIFDPSIFTTIIGTLKIAGPTAQLAHGLAEDIPYNVQIFIWITLFYMFTSVFLLALFLGILNFFKESEKTRKLLLLIIILILPQFAFLIRPGIAFYLPWAMRRQWAVFVPFVFLLFSLFLSNNKFFIEDKFKKRLFVVFGVLLFLIFSLPGLSVLSLQQGKGILQFEQEIASYFGKDDLVIFWDRYQYENWGPPLYFLYGTNVVFDRSPAFDPQIYALFMKDYKKVYIATSRRPDQNLGHPYFSEQTEFIRTFSSKEFKVLRGSCDVRQYIAQPKAFRGYYQIKELCMVNNPPMKIVDYQINLNIYKINNSFKKDFVEKYYDPNYEITKETENIWH